MTLRRIACAGSTIFIDDICDFAWYPDFHDEWSAWCEANGIDYDFYTGGFMTTPQQDVLIRLRWSSSK